MDTVPSLRITLPGVAALARVRRPVVSVWRSRFADSESPFPAPVAVDHGQAVFDAHEVAIWLVSTGHGNNPDAVADAAAHAVLPGAGPGDASGFAALTAVIALRAACGQSLGGLDVAHLLDLADATDPDDECLVREIDALGDDARSLAEFVDVLVDSAYAPAAAFESVVAARFRDLRRDLVRATLDTTAIDLVASAALELAASNPTADPSAPAFVDTTGTSGDLLIAIAERAREHLDLTLTTRDSDSDAARLVRRRLLAHGLLRTGLTVQETGEFVLDGPVVHVAAYPTPGGNESVADILAAVDNMVLAMDDTQRGVVIAPASALCDAGLDADSSEARSSILRTGRLRVIVRLPTGLLTSSPRQAMALWVLGPAQGSVPTVDRWTMTADLGAQVVTEASTWDLVGDLSAAMGDHATIRAHAFHFAHPVPTRSLLAGSGPLVSRSRPVRHAPVPVDATRQASATALRVDGLLATLNESLPVTLAVAETDPALALPPATLGELAGDRHVRYVPGNRIRPVDIGTGPGFTVIGTAELIGSAHPGERTIDRMLLAADYPSARLTSPGDIVFCTGPAPRARVDHAGSCVVEYPARVLRINAEDPAGLLPDVLADDIRHALPAAPAWKSWTARRVLPAHRASLGEALDTIRREREATRARLADLDRLARLVTQGVTDGTLTITGATTQPAASTQ